MLLLLASICLIACHGGPADHFATYAEALTEQGYDVQIYATGPALKKFQERNIKVNTPFALEHLQDTEENDLANLIAKSCSQTSLMMTDVGHPFAIKIQKAFANQAAHVTRLAYYDNPEPFVPGGYSLTASEVMHEAEGILFANENLAHATLYNEPGKAINFENRKRLGIGYYPINQAEKIAKRREIEHDKMRSEFFLRQGMEDKGQRLFVYFGGNNDDYFSKAFPAFLSLSEHIDSTHVIFIIQQHPGAKERNQDGQQLTTWLKQHPTSTIVLSDYSLDDAQVIADAAFYYQTSLGPQFVLAGIPTVQIGHETYADILVRNSLVPTITNATQLMCLMENYEKFAVQRPNKAIISQDLGIRKDWQNLLDNAIKMFIQRKDAKTQRREEQLALTSPIFASLRLCAFALNKFSITHTLYYS